MEAPEQQGEQQQNVAPVETQEIDKDEVSLKETPKKKRVISPEAKKKMLANLDKARKARAANKLSKYPVAKRERAKEMYQEDVAKEAERKAKELAKKMLEEEKQKAELEEFRKWKSTVSEKVEEPPKKTAPKKTEKKKTAPKKTPAKQPAEKKSTKKRVYFDDEPEVEEAFSYYPQIQQNSFNIDDYLS